ncbi:type II secretion system protein GspD [Psychroflexus tropicus]|uniref:type II secretion system protein GspD n=1 Tax=Psychroflexus tropicus TaxID=197345 RepID=UPI000364E731|nr:hypothetical protein [Psychroflexus tropicus]
MKFNFFILFTFLCYLTSAISQTDEPRINTIKNEISNLSFENEGFKEQVRTEINVNRISLSDFLLAVAEIHNLNFNVSPALSQIQITNNFNEVTVEDLIIFLVKEYNLDIDFTGNILAFKAYSPPNVEDSDRIKVEYDPNLEQVSIDIRNNSLYDVTTRIADATGKNIVYDPAIENTQLTAFIRSVPVDKALKQLALSNNLEFDISEEGFYILKGRNVENSTNQFGQSRENELNYQILDKRNRLIRLNLNDENLSDIITGLSRDLDLNIFITYPIESNSKINFKTDEIYFDEFLEKVFEKNTVSMGNPQNQTNQNQTNQTGNRDISNSQLTFKREGDTYYIGTEQQLSLRKVEFIKLNYRSVEMLEDPSGGDINTRRGAGRNFNGFGGNSFGGGIGGFNSGNMSGFNGGGFNSGGINNGGFNSGGNFSQGRTNQRSSSLTQGNASNAEKQPIVNLIPDEMLLDLSIKVDYELNSLYVSGPSQKVNRLKEYISKIDKAVPVVLIEVMIIEVSRNATVETGISWGLGDGPTETQGQLFPRADLTLSANSVNKVIGGFDGFGSFNLGKVVPNFFATIKAMESNGNLKIRSTPKLSTLSGHRATFSNGETSYYAVTQQNIIGANNPISSEVTNFFPIDAELGLTIKPIVSGDGQVTLDIFVIQSNFGERIQDDAPPNINSREFSSLIRVGNEDIVVLGGLEEQRKNDLGDGVPLLSRIPVIKWLFSQRRREDSKSKLTILIKPTIIY